jgi:site-specific DNA-methyltransferase (adenine-specific)
MILTCDVMDGLSQLTAKSVHCCVTSPPYYGLRDYGVDGQIGLEATLQEYINKLVTVFREVRRVLRDEGVLFLNLGDSYAGSGMGAANYLDSATDKQKSNIGSMAVKGRGGNTYGLKPKDLMGIPWRVAFALQADGWYLRQDIIWHKPNPMPESVHDRCTKAHEYLFLLSKNARYYFDAQAIKEHAVGFNNDPIAGSKGAFGPPQNRRRMHVPSGWDIDKGSHGAFHKEGRRKGNAKTFRGGGAYIVRRSFDNDGVVARESHGNERNETGLRNKRSVWTVASHPYAEAHFATFPTKLIEPCILAGSPKSGIVLDPFFGSGTTGEVAIKYGRECIGIELNPTYVELARKRISAVQISLMQGGN